MLELMVTLAIAAVLFAIAMPSMQDMMRASERGQISNGLYLALSQARYEAISRNTDVVVAPIGDSWNDGWQVFLDRDGNGQLDTGEEALSESDPVSDEFGVDEDSGATLVRFLKSGRASTTVSFTICGGSQADSRRVEASLAGTILLRDLEDLDTTEFSAQCPT